MRVYTSALCVWCSASLTADQSQLLLSASTQLVLTFLERCASVYGVGSASASRVCVGYGIGLTQEYKLALIRKGPAWVQVSIPAKQKHMPPVVWRPSSWLKKKWNQVCCCSLRIKRKPVPAPIAHWDKIGHPWSRVYCLIGLQWFDGSDRCGDTETIINELMELKRVYLWCSLN